ncbi:alpha/beta-hydrolase [Obba rivulosa]|uniref:Alpha/beta-hydrolase n=1 Tax=Obba rivulosa TaxID=1052685 RepID=A0A8E2DKA5_9APHY|nr:alpha/beta-hydrolase [Obba rivulosa]
MAFKAGHIPVDGNSTVLYYEDTGVPKGSSTYTTVFLVHGAMFHGATFRRTFPYAAANNLRLVALNLRDYNGSTAFSTEELEPLEGPVECQIAWMDARALEIAAFISRFIESEDLPAFAESSTGYDRVGGFALLGWSIGNILTLAMLARADKMPEHTRQLFSTHFRSLLMLDIAPFAVGETPPESLWCPLRDPSITDPAEILSQLNDWVGWYITKLPAPTTDVSVLASRKPLHKVEGSDALRFTPTVTRMTPAEVAGITNAQTLFGSQMKMFGIPLAVWEADMRRALLDCPREDDGAQPVWPTVRVKAIWGDMTSDDVVYATGQLSEKYAAQQKLGRPGIRPLEILRFEDGNHFPHWDVPERFVMFLADHV